MNRKLSATEIKDRQTTPKQYQCLHCDWQTTALFRDLPQCWCGHKDYCAVKEREERENALKKIAECALVAYTNENRNYMFELFFKLKTETLIQQKEELSKKIRFL